MAKKILALVSEPVSGNALSEAVGDSAEDAAVMVVAPALNDRVRFWASDSDAAIGRAEAIHDVLQTFDADEIVLFTHPGGKRNWLEEGLVEEAEKRFDVPVRHLVVEEA